MTLKNIVEKIEDYYNVSLDEDAYYNIFHAYYDVKSYKNFSDEYFYNTIIICVEGERYTIQDITEHDIIMFYTSNTRLSNYETMDTYQFFYDYDWIDEDISDLIANDFIYFFEANNLFDILKDNTISQVALILEEKYSITDMTID